MSVSEFLAQYEGTECFICFPEEGFEIYIPDKDSINSDSLKKLLDELWVVGFNSVDENCINITVNTSITFNN